MKDGSCVLVRSGAGREIQVNGPATAKLPGRAVNVIGASTEWGEGVRTSPPIFGPRESRGGSIFQLIV